MTSIRKALKHLKKCKPVLEIGLPNVSIEEYEKIMKQIHLKKFDDVYIIFINNTGDIYAKVHSVYNTPVRELNSLQKKIQSHFNIGKSCE